MEAWNPPWFCLYPLLSLSFQNTWLTCVRHISLSNGNLNPANHYPVPYIDILGHGKGGEDRIISRKSGLWDLHIKGEENSPPAPPVRKNLPLSKPTGSGPSSAICISQKPVLVVPLSLLGLKLHFSKQHIASIPPLYCSHWHAAI